VNALISAMLRSHALDWASTQKDNCRTYLLSPPPDGFSGGARRPASPLWTR
jgi:hypothetical protein